MSKKYIGSLGNAFAGHAFRVCGSPKASEYDNPLTDWINLLIAQAKAEYTDTPTAGKEARSLTGSNA
jgi:hypothetical protein